MSNMTLTLGGAALAVAVPPAPPAGPTTDAYGFTVSALISLFIFIDSKAVARIVGSNRSKVINGKTVHWLRCVKHTMVDGIPTDFTLCSYGPIDECVADDAKTWNGKPALLPIKLPEDIGSFGPEQLTYLLNAGQVMNRMDYRKAPAAKRVRCVYRR